MNVSSCVSHGINRLLSGPHSERARPDAETILLHLLEKNKAWLLTHSDDDVPDGLCARYSELVERRYRGEPIQYITGECEFYGLPFQVTRDVLIPRPETERLVEKVIEILGAPSFPRSLRKGWETSNLDSGPYRILDLGTGSGAIAVALAHHLPDAVLTAVDLSVAALTVARENARRNQVEDRIRFLHGDLLAPVAGERFDIVVSNPPYVPNTDRALIAVEVREYEPALALFAGQDGLAIYRRLIPAAYAALVPGGFIAIEMGFSQAEAVQVLLSDSGFQHIEFTSDLQGIPRVASAHR